MIGGAAAAGAGLVCALAPNSPSCQAMRDIGERCLNALKDVMRNESSDDKVTPGDKALSPGEIGKLKGAGIDPHDLKPSKNGSRYDLFKDKDGNISVKPKAGNGPGEPTGININNY